MLGTPLDTLPLSRWVRWLVGGRWPGLRAVASAATLTLPALAVGAQFDDHMINEAARQPLLDALGSGYVFTDGGPAEITNARAAGAVPWWTPDTARVAFFRPLASLTFWLDQQALGLSAFGAHVHTWLWFIGLLLALAAVFRQLFSADHTPSQARPGLVAALAIALYAIDDAHGHAVGWTANRAGLIAALFAALHLYGHVRWRRGEGARFAVAAVAALGGALAAGEAGVSVLAYTAAWALIVERGRWVSRLLSLAPYALLVVGYRAGYRALGYGAASTSYIDPLHDPIPFVLAVVERLPVLLLGQWGYPPAEGYAFAEGLLGGLWWSDAVAAMLLVARWVRPLVVRHPLAAFFAVGMVLSAVPACGGLPANRLLLLPGLGGAGLLALLFVEGRETLPRWAVRGLVVIHLVIGPLALPLAAYGPQLSGMKDDVLADLDEVSPLDGDDILLVLWAPSFFHPFYALFPRGGRPGAPGQPTLLYPGGGPFDVELLRAADDIVVVAAPTGFITGYEQVFRGRREAMTEGDKVQVPGAIVEVVDVEEGRPTRVQLTLLRPERLRWVTWKGDRFVDAPALQVGERRALGPFTP